MKRPKISIKRPNQRVGIFRHLHHQFTIKVCRKMDPHIVPEFNMYSTLLVIHSLFRWLVLATLIFSIYRAYIGFSANKTFSKGDNALRHWTATTAHIQLIIGIFLYIKSPITPYFWHNLSETIHLSEPVFFGLIHFLFMLTSVVLVTIGSALAKRQKTDKTQYKTMLIWFSLSLILILIAIPWPFSPFANRPYLRTF